MVVGQTLMGSHTETNPLTRPFHSSDSPLDAFGPIPNVALKPSRSLVLASFHPGCLPSPRSGMLSSLNFRGKSKRKSKKTTQTIRVSAPRPSEIQPDAFFTSEVFEIRAPPTVPTDIAPDEVSETPREQAFLDTPSPRLELKISNEDWFPSDILTANHDVSEVPPRNDSLPKIEEVDSSEDTEKEVKADEGGSNPVRRTHIFSLKLY